MALSSVSVRISPEVYNEIRIISDKEKITFIEAADRLIVGYEGEIAKLQKLVAENEDEKAKLQKTIAQLQFEVEIDNKLDATLKKRIASYIKLIDETWDFISKAKLKVWKPKWAEMHKVEEETWDEYNKLGEQLSKVKIK